MPTFPNRTLALGAAVLAVNLVACGKGDAAQANAAAPAPITLAPENVAVVEDRTLEAGPEISGTLRARRAASLRAEVAGAVLEVVAQAGDRVKAGQLLARIDDSALADALLAARSGISSAGNNVAVAESNATRARTLAEAGAISPQNAEQAEAGLEAARAGLADAQARLAQARLMTGKTRVRAPFAGVVSERQVSPGDVVAPGAPLFTVIDPARLEFEAAVPAAQVSEIRPGAAVQFRVTGFGDGFQGKVDRMNPAVDPATGQVRLYVDVPNASEKLLAGLYAQGRVATEKRTAPSAPDTAVDTSSQPHTVLLVADGKVRKVPVEVVVRDEVAGAVGFGSGVKPGDVLVLGSARGALVEGAAVRVAAPGERTAGRRAAPAGAEAKAN
jgi:membrane fusion protein (multidrug efflux system)